MNVKNLTELRGSWLLTTPTTLNLTGVKVLQNTVKTEGVGSDKGAWLLGGVWPERGGGGGYRQGRGQVTGCGSHGSHGLVLEGDEGHAQRFGVDLLLLLPVLLLQLGLPLGVVADRLLLRDKCTMLTHR